MLAPNFYVRSMEFKILPRNRFLLLVFALLLVSAPIHAETIKHQKASITSCIIDGKVTGNPIYYHLPNQATFLVCDGINETGLTMTSLYARGWRLLQIVNVDSRLATKDQKVPSPMLYFEK